MKKIIKLILVIIWMLTIFLFSNQKSYESTKLSDGVIVKISNILIKNIDKEKQQYIIDKYVVITRKLAHFLIYLILGILVCNLIKECRNNPQNIIIISIFICFIYACSDEIHQIFIIGRSGELKDVIIDNIGSIIGILLYIKINKLIKYK